jgi:chromate reductase
MRVLAISGSLRAGSFNSLLLRAAAAALPAGAQMELWDELALVPPFDEDREHDAVLAVARFRRSLALADAVLVSTPEYNGSIPGQLKNALDWASRPYATNPLRGKPVAVIGAATGLFGAVWAQADLRRVLEAIGARVLDGELAVGGAEHAFASDGALADPSQSAALAALVAELAGAAEAAPVAI